MNQAITKYYEGESRNKSISFSFPIWGYEKMTNTYSILKKIYKKTIIHDFYRLFTAKIE